MLLDRDRVIGALSIMKVPFMNDMEVQDILDSAIQMLKDGAPVEPEEHEIRDSDTGELLTIARYCGVCGGPLDNQKRFCAHCGRRWISK